MEGLNKRMKRVRLQNGYSLQEIADFLGVAKSTYCGYEVEMHTKHYREPSIDKLVKLAKLYDVSLDYLLCNSELVANHDKEYVINKIKNNLNINDPLKNLVIDTINRSLIAI